MAARIAAHRARRPSSWSTIEPEGDALLPALDAVTGTLLLDSLTAWVAAAPDFEADVEGLCRVLSRRSPPAVVVSDEVGLGVHPSSEAGRRFRDRLGTANQAVAAVADQVLLVIAGRALELLPAPGGPIPPGA